MKIIIIIAIVLALFGSIIYLNRHSEDKLMTKSEIFSIFKKDSLEKFIGSVFLDSIVKGNYSMLKVHNYKINRDFYLIGPTKTLTTYNPVFVFSPCPPS